VWGGEIGREELKLQQGRHISCSVAVMEVDCAVAEVGSKLGRSPLRSQACLEYSEGG